jgi:hypothetical protein
MSRKGGCLDNAVIENSFGIIMEIRRAEIVQGRCNMDSWLTILIKNPYYSAATGLTREPIPWIRISITSPG